MNVKQINLYNQDYNIKDAFGRALIAADFKSTYSYEIGDLVWYGNLLYKCLSSCSGSWDWNNWSQTTILENFSQKEEEVEITYDQKVVDELVYFLSNRENITKISNDAEFIRSCCFQQCYSLQSANFSMCSYIGASAFYNCISLQSVDFPVCNYIGSYAFQSCSSLQSVDFPICSYIDQYAFQQCNSLQSANFPVCSYIGGSAFDNCSSLQSVNFPVCSYIGASAFNKCSSLQSVDFPICSYIGQSAFNGCSSLQSVNFLMCSYIGSSAFYNCRSLQSINLLASSVCTLVGSKTFYNTPISRSTYLGYFGSIYVPSSLVDAYKSATNWTYYSNRITAYQE